MEFKSILEKASITSTFHKTSESASVISDNTLRREMNSIKKRYVLAIYAFLGFFIAYALRANLSVAIVDMAKMESAQDVHPTTATTTTSPSHEDGNTSQAYSANTTSPTMTTVHYGDKKWSPILQGYVLSSFFFGYIVTQLVRLCFDTPETLSSNKRTHFGRCFLSARRLLDHQIWWKTIFWSRNRLLRSAESVHAFGNSPRSQLRHRPPCGSRPSSRICISRHALPVVKMGASFRALASGHVCTVRLLHWLGFCTECRRDNWKDLQLAGHFLRLW